MQTPFGLQKMAALGSHPSFPFCRNHLFRLNLEDLTLIQVSFIYHPPGPLGLTSLCVRLTRTPPSVCSLLFTLAAPAQTWGTNIRDEPMNSSAPYVAPNLAVDQLSICIGGRLFRSHCSLDFIVGLEATRFHTPQKTEARG